MFVLYVELVEVSSICWGGWVCVVLSSLNVLVMFEVR